MAPYGACAGCAYSRRPRGSCGGAATTRLPALVRVVVELCAVQCEETPGPVAPLVTLLLHPAREHVAGAQRLTRAGPLSAQAMTRRSRSVDRRAQKDAGRFWRGARRTLSLSFCEEPSTGRERGAAPQKRAQCCLVLCRYIKPGAATGCAPQKRSVDRHDTHFLVQRQRMTTRSAAADKPERSGRRKGKGREEDRRTRERRRLPVSARTSSAAWMASA